MKKILITSASLLMFASVGAGISSSNINVLAKSGRIVCYVGKSHGLGIGVPGLVHGQRLKIYNYTNTDDDGVTWVSS